MQNPDIINNQEDILNRVLPYRLNAVSAYEVVMNEMVEKGLPNETLIAFDGKVKIIGNGATFINPVFEIGLVHSRALLDFLGLKVSSKNPKKLVQRKGNSKHDDIYIENIQKNGKSLKMVSVQEARTGIKGHEDEVEEAFALTYYWANKMIAHITNNLPTDPETVQPIILGAKGIQKMVLYFVYDELDLPHPDYEVKLLDKQLIISDII